MICCMQQRSQEARQNWEAALESKDRALSQLEDALLTQKRSLQQQIEQQQSAVSMTHNQFVHSNDAQILMQRQLDSSQQQVLAHKTRAASVIHWVLTSPLTCNAIACCLSSMSCFFTLTSHERLVSHAQC